VSGGVRLHSVQAGRFKCAGPRTTLAERRVASVAHLKSGGTRLFVSVLARTPPEHSLYNDRTFS